MKKLKTKSGPSDIFGSRNDVRIAAVLGKTHAARYLHPEDIARDAVELHRLMRRTRDAAQAQKPIDKLTSKVRVITQRYDAVLVCEKRHEVDQVFGLRFLDGSFPATGRGVFYICRTYAD